MNPKRSFVKLKLIVDDEFETMSKNRKEYLTFFKVLISKDVCVYNFDKIILSMENTRRHKIIQLYLTNPFSL